MCDQTFSAEEAEIRALVGISFSHNLSLMIDYDIESVISEQEAEIRRNIIISQSSFNDRL